MRGSKKTRRGYNKAGSKRVGKYRQKVGIKTGEGRKKTSRKCKKHRKGAVNRQARGYKETCK
jgi:hypothetical protein